MPRLSGLYEDNLLPLAPNMADVGSLSKPWRNIIGRDVIGLNSLTVPTLDVNTLRVSFPGGAPVGQFSATGIGGNFNVEAVNGADMRFLGNGSERMRLTNAGILQIGLPASIVNAVAGDIVLANAAYVRAANQAGSAAVGLLRLNTSNAVIIAPDVSVVAVGAPGSLAGASTGDVVIANSRDIRGANAGSTSTIPLIRATGGDAVQIGAGGPIILLGVPASSAAASAGDVVLANNSNLRGPNAAGTTTHQLIGINSGDQVVIGTGTNNVRLATGGGLVQIATAVTSGAGGGDLILPNNASYRNVNAAGTGTQIVARVGSSNQIQIGPDAVSGEFFAFGAPGSVVNATQGDLILQNTKALRGANAGASAALILVDLNSSNIVRLAPDGGDILWGRANVALGAGGPATLGNTGGSGPAATAQRAWLRVIESDGVASFMPLFR